MPNKVGAPSWTILWRINVIPYPRRTSIESRPPESKTDDFKQSTPQRSNTYRHCSPRGCSIDSLRLRAEHSRFIPACLLRGKVSQPPSRDSTATFDTTHHASPQSALLERLRLVISFSSSVYARATVYLLGSSLLACQWLSPRSHSLAHLTARGIASNFSFFCRRCRPTMAAWN